MATSRFARTERGFTLLELLLVVALLGLVVALLASSTADTSEKAAFQALVNEIENLDARARLYARSGTPVSLSTDAANHRLVANAIQGGAPVQEVKLPTDALVSLLRDGAGHARSVVFHPSGTSPDYSIEIRRGEHIARLDVAGLTGWVSRSERAQ